jgi:hypothetical protein
MELVTAARRHALKQDSIKNLVLDRVFKHKLRLFNDDGEPMALEGTGWTALVFKSASGWAAAERTKTSEYPILVVECWADHSRQPDDSHALKLDQADRAQQLWREVDRVFHVASGEHQRWPDSPGGLYIEGSTRSREPDGPLEIDGVAVVRGTYNIKTFH